MTRITFLGAAGTVTGSRYLVETSGRKILVDCGLFQGLKVLRERNWSSLPFSPASLNAVILTHAHIDHSGFLPRLCKLGFRGRVFCTSGTRDLLEVLLPDSGHLQEEEAKRANQYGYSKHHPALPLYTRDEAEASLCRLRAFEFHETFEPAVGVSAQFTRAGHILGSACLSLSTDGGTIVFSGDVGRPVDPIMKPPDSLPPTDYLVIESTYGDRTHPNDDISMLLERVVLDTVTKSGVIVVPAFAVGRAQHLLHLLAQLRRAGRIPAIPVFLDSPMAGNATRIFCRHTEDHGLSEHECHEMCHLARYTRTAEESKSIDLQSGPMIVISASGMATGGRVLHHLERFLPDRRNAVLMVGYQAAGTRGRSIVDGDQDVRIYGNDVPVRARVVQINGLSGHADSIEMTGWLRRSAVSPKRVFVTHGELRASDAFRTQLETAFGWNSVVPEDGSSWIL